MLILGVVGALSAQLFAWMLKAAGALLLTRIGGYHAPGLPEEGGVLTEVIGSHGLWLVPISTTLGGLISGLLVYRFAPEAEGHGTDTAVRAFHNSAGAIRARVPILKAIASAITIGSGGSAGREGPTALVSGGIGSIYAKLGKRTDDERRLLLLAGMAAGLSAIFRSPLGTALFSIEVLYSGVEFEASALLYTLLASVTAYAVNGAFSGWQPLFRVPPNLSVHSLADYGWYAVLGLACAVVAAALPNVFYRLRDGFHKIALPPHIKPAIGGLGVGLIALALPQVLGGGYGWVQEAIDGRLDAALMATLMLAKLLAFSLTVSSGGSGGVFAPTLYVGAMLGGFLAEVVHLEPAAFAVVGMAALFGGAARVPIASLLMVTEMTGGYKMLAPAALAVIISYLVQASLAARFHLPYRSLYEAQVPRRFDSAAHYLEHIRASFELLGKYKPPLAGSIGRLDLVSLLRAGVPVDLPDGKMFYLGTVQPGSALVGKKTEPACPDETQNCWETVVVIRDDHLLPRGPDSKFQARDQVLVVCPADAAGSLEEQFRPASTPSQERPPAQSSDGQ